MIVRALLSKSTSIERRTGMKVSMKGKKIEEADERDEKATALTLSIYRD